MANNYKNNSKNNETSVGTQITASILILSILLSFTVGMIGGYFIGESRAETRVGNYVTSGNQGNKGNQGTQEDNNNQSSGTVQESVDYSQYVINADKGVTVENFYNDAETKQYASQLIGMKMPTIKWTTSDGKEHSNADFGDKPYIIEIFSPSCMYCNASIEHVDAFREANTDIPLVSITTETGDISAFNTIGENAFSIANIDTSFNSVLNYIPWIPAFLYVENGNIKLVTYGGINDQTEIVKYGEVVFGQN